MGQPFIGEIRMFGGNFPPIGWMFCDGQLVPISENEVLFNLIGTTYGGDGQETFALPNLMGRVPMHQGGSHVIGELSGVESVTLTTQQIPQHNHTLNATASGQVVAPTSSTIMATAASAQPGVMPYFTGATDGTLLNSNTLQATGGSQPHDNMQPYLVVSYIISMFGVFPTQN
jgi:microcystin-dependent protein